MPEPVQPIRAHAASGGDVADEVSCHDAVAEAVPDVIAELAQSLIDVDHPVGVDDADGALRSALTATIPSVAVTPRRPG